jgi:L-lactate dehydrogenase
MVHHPGRVSIIGAGTLGGTIAYSLMMNNIAKEILLVDMSHNIVQGQVLDLQEASEGTDIVIRAGTFKEAGQSTLVIVTADTQPNDKEDRSNWLIRSRNLLLSIASSMSPVHSDIMLLVASDPVDLYVQSFQSYFPHVSPNKIFGIGTTMATVRFNTWLAEMSHNKHTVSDAYCIGSQNNPVVLWNHAKVNDVSVPTIPFLVSQKSLLDKIVSNYRFYLICERKGKAWFGMAATLTRLTSELLGCTQQLQSTSAKIKGKGKADASSASTSSAILPYNNMPPHTWVLSVHVPQYDCCLSWPAMISINGIERVVDLPLASDESSQVLEVVQSNLADLKTSMATASS